MEDSEIKKTPVWRKLAGLAACLCILAVSLYPWKAGSAPAPNQNCAAERGPETSGSASAEPESTISAIDLPQGSTGEFAGDMHRPEGFNENIGSALALKMSITDDVSCKFSVLIRIPDGSTLGQALDRANEGLDMAINIDDAAAVNISGDFDTAGEYYCPLTSEQITALAESGTKCLYIGSGQGEYKDMDWDTREGINAYCELNGDMYVLSGDGIEAHPDIWVEE